MDVATRAAEGSSGASREGGAIATFSSIARPHIVAIGGLGTLTFAWVLYGVHAPGIAALSALDWFLINLLNRVVDRAEDTRNAVAGASLVARHRRAVVGFGVALLAASFALHLVYLPRLAAPRAIVHALGFAYNWRLPGARRRIKELYFWKNTASATGFVLTCIVGPLVALGWDRRLALAPDVGIATVIALVAFFFPFELSFEVLYDLRDVAGDRESAVQTFPVVHGVKAAARIVDGLLALSILSLLAAYAVGAAPWRLAVMVVAPALQGTYAHLARRRREITSGDCVRLTWIGATLLALYHGWILLGLPGVG